MIDITDEITRLWGKLTGKTPNLWITDYSNVTQADIKNITDYAISLKETLFQAWLEAKISYNNVYNFRATYAKFYDIGSNPNDIFGSAYLDNQWNALDDATFTVLELLNDALAFTVPTANTLGYLKSLNTAVLRVCDDASNWHQYSGNPLSVVQSIKDTKSYGYYKKPVMDYEYPFSFVLQHKTGPVAVIDINGTIIEVLDPLAFTLAPGIKNLTDIPILPHDPIPTDGDFIEHTNEYTVLWLICQLRYAKAMLDSVLDFNVYLYNQKNPTTPIDPNNPLISLPPSLVINQDKNDQYVPPGQEDNNLPPPVVTENPPPLPQPNTPSDEYKLTTELITDTTPSEGKESTTMNWLVPVLAGLFGAAAMGGVIWYSVKKEEQYGLIGPKAVKRIAEPSLKMPNEVKQVVNTMQDNATKAGQLEDSVYVASNMEQGDEVWVIGDNYERVSLNLVYKNGVWYYRDSYGELDKPMKNGFKEALANAQVFYTG